MDSSLDVRLHAPTRDVVIVWATGAVDRSTAGLLALRTRQQFRRARHVIVDLTAVSDLDPGALDVLRALHDQASRRGTQLYIAQGGCGPVVRVLRNLGCDQQPTDGPAAAVLARLVPDLPAQQSPDPTATKEHL